MVVETTTVTDARDMAMEIAQITPRALETIEIDTLATREYNDDVSNPELIEGCPILRVIVDQYSNPDERDHRTTVARIRAQPNVTMPDTNDGEAEYNGHWITIELENWDIDGFPPFDTSWMNAINWSDYPVTPEAKDGITAVEARTDEPIPFEQAVTVIKEFTSELREFREQNL